MAQLAQPHRILPPLTPEQLRREAKEFRAAAAQSGPNTHTGKSYLRLAARCETRADALEAEAERAGQGRDCPE
jgi:hypothetical protein